MFKTIKKQLGEKRFFELRKEYAEYINKLAKEYPRWLIGWQDNEKFFKTWLKNNNLCNPKS